MNFLVILLWLNLIFCVESKTKSDEEPEFGAVDRNNSCVGLQSPPLPGARGLHSPPFTGAGGLHSTPLQKLADNINRPPDLISPGMYIFNLKLIKKLKIS